MSNTSKTSKTTDTSSLLKTLTETAFQKDAEIQKLQESIHDLRAEIDRVQHFISIGTDRNDPLNDNIGLGHTDRQYYDNENRRFRPYDDSVARYAEEENDYLLRRYFPKPEKRETIPVDGRYPSDYDIDPRYLDKELLTQTRYAPKMARRVGVHSATLQTAE